MFDMRPLADIGTNLMYARIAHSQLDMMAANISAQQQMMQSGRSPYDDCLGLMNYFRPNVPKGWADWYATGDELQ